MGNQLAASGAAATVNITDVSTQLQYVSSLGGKRRGRLFTSMHCLRSTDIVGVPPSDVVVKVFVRAPDDRLQAQLITKHAEELAAIENKLEVNFRRNQDSACNLLFYHEMDRKSERYCKLQRPFVQYSLLDRLHVRPYLDAGEKLFACFQLLQGLSQLHDQFQCVHGDLKPENVLINSRGWVYITDVCPYKPRALPSYNPADFEFYFDTAETRNCCIAPEKFYDSDATKEEISAMKHTPQMDVFSAGCVIAHILTGEALFRLATLLEFRSKQSPAEKEIMLRSKLAPFAMPSDAVVDMLCEMLCLGPDMRPSAAKIVEKYTPGVFPAYFPFLHANVLPPILRRPPDTVLHFVWSRFDDVLRAVDRCVVDSQFAQRMSQVQHNPPRQKIAQQHSTQQHVSSSAIEIGGGGDLVASLSMSLNFSSSPNSVSGVFPPPPAAADLSPMEDVAVQPQHRTLALSLLLPVVCSAMRHCVTPDARIKGLQVIRKAAAISSNDLSKRDVLLPFSLHFVKDMSLGHYCRAMAIEALAAVCVELQQCPPGESMMFEDIVLPAIYDAMKENDPVVTLSIAKVLPQLLKLATDYLQKRQVHHAGGSTWLSGYDFQLFNIVNNGWECIKTLFKQQDSMVKVAILKQTSAVVRLIGEERAQDELIPMLTTMIAEPAIEAKRELLRQAILCHLELKAPRLHFLQFFVDEGLRQEDVPCIGNTIEALIELIKVQKLPVEGAVLLVHQAVPQIAHPSVWVHSAARRLVEVASQLFCPCDILLHLQPAIRPFLTHCVPLAALTQFPNVVRRDISFTTGVDGVIREHQRVCSEYHDLFPDSPGIITVPSKARERSFADVIVDVNHVDVGFPRNVEENAKMIVWPMSFKPHMRQLKRILRRSSIHYSSPVDRSGTMVMARAWMGNGSATSTVGNGSGIGTTTQQQQVQQRSAATRTKSAFPADGNTTSNLSFAGSAYTSGGAPSGSGGVAAQQQQQPQSTTATGGLLALKPTASVMTTSRDHSGPIYALCSARGVLVSGGAKGIVKVWELGSESSNTPQASAAGVTRLVPVTVKDAVPNDSTVLSMEFLRDGGSDMVVGIGVSDGSVRFMEPESGSISRTVQLVNGGRSASAVTCSQRFSNDVMLFGTAAGEVVVVDYRSHKSAAWRTQLAARDGAITCMTAVATRENIVSGFPAFACGTSTGTIALFDLRIRVEVLSFSTASTNDSSTASSTSPPGILSMVIDPSFCCKFGPSSANPAVIVSTASKTITRFDLAAGKSTLTLQTDSPSETRCMLQVPRTTCLYTAGSDRRVRVWDFAQPANSYTMFCAPQVSPKYSLDRSVSVGTPTIREGKPERNTSMHHEDNITSMAVALVRNRQHLVTAARDGSLTIWHNFTQPAPAK